MQICLASETMLYYQRFFNPLRKAWLNEDVFLDKRMINVLILKQFSCILVNDIP